MSGLFSTFNVAKRGMFVQQKAINVTSHNIANANTEGYSRQRAVIETTKPFGMPSMNSVAEPGQLGTGSQISAIQRIRDSFLDFQVRTETSTHGQFSARQKFLTEIESIFNEPSDTGLSTLMGKFFDSFQQLSKQPQSSNSRTVVAQQSAALAGELNHSYNQLKKLKENTQSLIKNTVFDMNNILSQVDQLNQQIMGVKIAGNMPNDLMDKRDLLLDQLSSKFNIEIEKKGFEGYDVKSADGSEGVANNLIQAVQDGTEKRFSYISKISETTIGGVRGYEITYNKLGDSTSGDKEQTLKVAVPQNSDETPEDYEKRFKALYSQIDESRTIWSDKEGIAVRDDGTLIGDGEIIALSDLNLFTPSDGEMKGYMSVQKDINEYMDQLNKLAKSIALTVNAVHSGKDTAGADRMPFFVNSKVAKYTPDNLMSNVDDILAAEFEITAENIAVNSEIIYDVMKIKTRTNDDKFDYASDNLEDGETDGTRALAIAKLRDVFVKIQDITDKTSRVDLLGGKLLDKGLGIQNNINGMKVDTYFKDTVNRLGIQNQEARRMVRNQESLLGSFQESRLSVSGVSLDEEMANLVQFQHAYSANAKMISVIDELLDVVVNGLKR